jgi:hypothetical protein
MAGTVLALGGRWIGCGPSARGAYSGFQIRVSQRLQLGDADNAAPVGNTPAADLSA